MMEGEVCRIHEERGWFLQQVIMHHRAGDYYPDPRVIGRELRFTPMQTDAVLLNLRALGWIAASPYDPERLRLTPRCWDLLSRTPVGSLSQFDCAPAELTLLAKSA
jgi:hypothetical protein